MRQRIGLCGIFLAALTACSAYQLILRQSSMDWEKLGITTVAVVPGPAMTTSLGATGSAPSPGLAASAYLAAKTREACELLGFALRQSVVDVQPESATLPRLEVTVKELTSAPALDSPSPTPSEDVGYQGIPSLRAELGLSNRSQRVVRATLRVRLLRPRSHGQADEAIWQKEEVGTVDFWSPQTVEADALFPGTSNDGRSKESSYLEDVAIRRALKQIADDMLPHYEYQELR